MRWRIVWTDGTAKTVDSSVPLLEAIVLVCRKFALRQEDIFAIKRVS